MAQPEKSGISFTVDITNAKNIRWLLVVILSIATGANATEWFERNSRVDRSEMAHPPGWKFQHAVHSADGLHMTVHYERVHDER